MNNAELIEKWLHHEFDSKVTVVKHDTNHYPYWIDKGNLSCGQVNVAGFAVAIIYDTYVIYTPSYNSYPYRLMLADPSFFEKFGRMIDFCIRASCKPSTVF